MKKHKTKTIYDNAGNPREVYADLKEGDKVVAKETVMGLEDFGMSGAVFSTERWEKGHEYTIKGLRLFGFSRVPYFIDETGCVAWAETKHFNVVE